MISIIIPTYNRSQLVKRAIESVINQSSSNWELIIVDDGSIDNTKEVVERYLKDERIKYIKKENTGAPASRNLGVEHSSYDWITFLDSDDFAEPNWLEVINPIIHSNKNLGLVSCGCRAIDENDTFLSTSLPSSKRKLFGNYPIFKMTNGGVFFIRKMYFYDVGMYDINVKAGQHTELSFRLIPYLVNNKIDIHYVNDILINVFIHNGERIRNNTKGKYEGSKYVLSKHKYFFSSRKKIKSKYQSIIAYNALRSNYYKDSFIYSWKSFFSYPSFNKIFRAFYYSFISTFYILTKKKFD